MSAQRSNAFAAFVCGMPPSQLSEVAATLDRIVANCDARDKVLTKMLRSLEGDHMEAEYAALAADIPLAPDDAVPGSDDLESVA